MPTLNFLSCYLCPVHNLPAGYDTVASFAAKHSPAALHLYADQRPDAAMLGELFADDEAQLRELSAMLGLPVIMVPASEAYRAAGVDLQPAFQVGLIYGVLHHAA
ncbi:hypothetical protein AMST5_04245 [freshwater sediment metagenome]|uniref:Uncharacterized protein n=1 Tax=freshwater sediment metagenome TaxID=556182 RepID=A0AA48M3I7_9ZZZZ